MKKDNYLKKHIKAFFTETTAINANIHIIDTLLTTRTNQLKAEFPISGYTLYSMISVYRDLSQINGGDNLYDTGNQYNLTTDNLTNESSRLISYVSCLTVSQVFEVFESFLKNILAEIISRNNGLSNILNIQPANNDFLSIRESIRLIQGTNNKGFIKAFRKISPFFKEYENNNIWQENMSTWFNFLMTVRHIVIHQRQIVSSDFKAKIKSGSMKKIFDKHFSLNNDLLILTSYEANVIIDHLYEYAHLIYKGLSNDFNLNMDFDFKS